MPHHHHEHRLAQVNHWIYTRDYVRSFLSYKQASAISNAFVRYVPCRIQRIIEKGFNYPVNNFVRGSHILLIRIPKTASVSLSLQLYGQVAHIPHRTADFYRNADPKFFNSSVSLAIMRDPLERAISAYNWLRNRGSRSATPDSYGLSLVAGVRSFDQFVSEVLQPSATSGRLQHLDPVLHEQYKYVCDTQGTIIVNHLFLLSNMDDIQKFLSSHGVKRSEYYENKTQYNYEKVHEVSPRTKYLVYDIYSRDLAMVDEVRKKSFRKSPYSE